MNSLLRVKKILRTPLNLGLAELAGLPAVAITEASHDGTGGLEGRALLARLEVAALLALHVEEVDDGNLLPLLRPQLCTVTSRLRDHRT